MPPLPKKMHRVNFFESLSAWNGWVLRPLALNLSFDFTILTYVSIHLTTTIHNSKNSLINKVCVHKVLTFHKILQYFSIVRFKMWRSYTTNSNKSKSLTALPFILMNCRYRFSSFLLCLLIYINISATYGTYRTDTSPMTHCPKCQYTYWGLLHNFIDWEPFMKDTWAVGST